MKAKYHDTWSGIDAGREGLWREPIWSRVMELVACHEMEDVYNRESPIYLALEQEFPNEKWRSQTREGFFRPLFRDYPNSWTKTGVLMLANHRFRLTELGKMFLQGKTTKQQILLRMFASVVSMGERPFSILASAFISAHRPLSTEEVYWCIVRNWRPGSAPLKDEVGQPSLPRRQKILDTPRRRLRNLLALMRAAEAIQSHLRGGKTWWAAQDIGLLKQIANDK